MGAPGSDVVVIGGGVMGCGIALRLAQGGLKVTVLERSIPGAEASSAAGGILAPQQESEGPGPFLDLCLRSRALYASFAEELLALTGVNIGYLPCGLIHATFSEDKLHELEAQAGWQRGLGLRVELLDGKQARELEPALSTRVAGGLHFPDDHQVDNRLLMRALQMAAASAGVRFKSGYVRGIVERDGRAVGVDLDGEVLSAEAVVLAAGSWSGLVQGAKVDPRTVRPARGQMLLMQTRLPIAKRVLFSDTGYLVPRADGRLLAGSTMELVGYEKQVTAGGLAKILKMALELCPELEGAPVQEFWAGLRPYTDDHLPILGEGPLQRLFLATGHFRNGILLAPITARLISQVVLGQTPSVDLAPFRYDRFNAKQAS